MSSVTHPSRSSIHPTFLQSKSNQIHLDPTTVPLPPSPPPTETLDLDDHSTQPDQKQSNTKRSSSSNQIKSNEDPFNQSTTNQITTHSHKRSRSDDHQSIQTASPPISSPIQTHPNHHSNKRTKLERSQSQSIQSSPQESKPSSSISLRDSPNNPFLMKQGESVRQAGRFHDEKSRKLVYVFRGKRIQYDPGEDLHNTGDSPFKLSTPKLLFPSHETKPFSLPSNKLGFETNDPFSTPKKDQKKNNDLIRLGLPTPQQTHQKKISTVDLLNGHGTGIDGNPSSSSNHTKQSISKGMR